MTVASDKNRAGYAPERFDRQFFAACDRLNVLKQIPVNSQNVVSESLMHIGALRKFFPIQKSSNSSF